MRVFKDIAQIVGCILDHLMPGVAQALKVRSFKNAQGVRALLLDAPAKLFLDHELVKQHNVRL